MTYSSADAIRSDLPVWTKILREAGFHPKEKKPNQEIHGHELPALAMPAVEPDKELSP